MLILKTLAAIAFALVFGIGEAFAKTLTIAVDLSGSSPLLSDKHFVMQSRRYVEAQIKQLEEGDVVKLKFFGSLLAPENFKQTELPITRHNKKKVAEAISFQFGKLKDNAKAQSATNLLAFLGRNKFDCHNGGKVIVLTDGIEVSEQVDPVKLITGKAQLPQPHEFVKLQGCDVIFYGLGVGRSETVTLNLRRAWHAWFTQANASFDVE